MLIAEAERIFMDVRAEQGEAWDNLKAKAQWEHMSLLAVIMNWGDPRKWRERVNQGGGK